MSLVKALINLEKTSVSRTCGDVLYTCEASIVYDKKHFSRNKLPKLIELILLSTTLNCHKR